MASSDFTVGGLSLPQVIPVSWGDTVSCALVSIRGVNSVAWSVLAKSRSTLSTPTLTPAGSPSGATMSFTFPAEDAYFGYGGSLLIQCVVSYTIGGKPYTHTTRAIIGVKDLYDRVPGVVGESPERGAYGWSGLINSDDWYHDILTTSDTASHDVLTVTCPTGILLCEFMGTAWASGLYRTWIRTETVYVTGSSITAVDTADTDETGTMVGTWNGVGFSSNQIIYRCMSNAGDGSAVWKASLRILRHTV